MYIASKDAKNPPNNQQPKVEKKGALYVVQLPQYEVALVVVLADLNKLLCQQAQ